MTEEVKKHGMGTDLVEPTWATLSVSVVQAILSYYPQFKAVTEIEWHSPRPFSSAAIVKLDGERYFVKRHAAQLRNEQGLLEEHAALQHLAANGIPVSRLVAGQNNQTAFEVDGWTYEIHEIGTGVDMYRDAISWSPFSSKHHAFAAGEMLAKVHHAMESFTKEKRSNQPLISDFEIFMSDEPLAAVERFAADKQGLVDYLQNKPWREDFKLVLMSYYEAFKPYRAVLKPLYTHNDWHASNLLWTDASEMATVATVLDFGLSNTTNAIYDLATALERNVVKWLEIMDPSQRVIDIVAATALLQGYMSVRPLSADEKYALVTMLPIVHTDFALSEIDYFMRITNSETDADEAYYTFLLDHATWFQSEQGQQLLTAIRQELNI